MTPTVSLEPEGPLADFTPETYAYSGRPGRSPGRLFCTQGRTLSREGDALLKLGRGFGVPVKLPDSKDLVRVRLTGFEYDLREGRVDPKEKFRMLSNRLAFAALAVACIAAAAGGSYVASRQSVARPAAAAPGTLPSERSSLSTPVQETEALVGDTTLKAEAAPAPTTPTEGVKRAEAPAHAAAQASARIARPAAAPVKNSERSAAKAPSRCHAGRTWPSGAAANTPSTPAPRQRSAR
jgi:hypothetical protein